jgi:oxygen-independent coproporphyrinogen-3 oxidase
VNSQAPVEAYLDTLRKEIATLVEALPDGVSVGRLHWGGGTPTILSAPQITRLAQMIRDALPFEKDAEFSVEIDPACVSPDKLDALVAANLTRASVGIQDFAYEVQDTIGRHQSFAQTSDVLSHLRKAGVDSLNADLVYGLPRQSLARLSATLDQVLDFDPDRIALFGYAHVPWMSKRQAVIPEDTLPDPVTRLTMAETAARHLVNAGFDAIGIDHFAKPNDSLAIAAREGRLRRNFQGYVDDTIPVLIGLGASSISKLPQGYAQNAPATPAYTERVEAGLLPVVRGYALTEDDLIRAQVIDALMCDFRVNLDTIRADYPLQAALRNTAQIVAMQWPEAVALEGSTLSILAEGVPMTRMIAQAFDTFSDPRAERRHSQAI